MVDQSGMAELRRVMKQGAPGPPPRPGLEWRSETHRWVRPMYHGTSDEKHESIRREGLKEGSYVTDDPEVADYYSDGVVLRVDVSEEQLEGPLERWPGEPPEHWVVREPIHPSDVRVHKMKKGDGQ